MRKAIKILFFSFLMAFVSCSDYLNASISTTIYNHPNQFIISVKKTISEIPFKNFTLTNNLENYFVQMNFNSEKSMTFYRDWKVGQSTNPYLILNIFFKEEVINHEVPASAKAGGGYKSSQ